MTLDHKQTRPVDHQVIVELSCGKIEVVKLDSYSECYKEWREIVEVWPAPVSRVILARRCFSPASLAMGIDPMKNSDVLEVCA